MAGAPQHPPAVVIVGFMGAGKSAVGVELAARLGVPFVDTDALIVAAAGPIPGIFAVRGEAGFRELEADIVVREIRASAETPRVLALGGGAVQSGEVREALRLAPCVIWLTAPAEELWRRVAAAGAGERPLARDEDAFRALLAAREPLYREVATLAADTAGRSPVAVAEDLAVRLSAIVPQSAPQSVPCSPDEAGAA